jgi:cytochrome P450
VTLVATGGALALGVYLVTTKSSSRRAKNPTFDDAEEAPSLPGSSFFLGDLVAAARNQERVHDWMAENTLASGGKPWVMRIPGQIPMVMVPTPEGVEDILTNQFDKFPRGEFQGDNLEIMFGRSIVNSDGTRWYHQRKAAAKFFTAKSLRSCMKTNMDKNVHQMYEVIDRAIATQGTVDLGKLFHEFALQTFLEVGLGLNLRWIGSADGNPLDAPMEIAAVQLLKRFRMPVWYWHTTRFLNIGNERQLADSMNTVRAWIRTVIAKSLDATREAQTKRAEKTVASDEDYKSVMELFLEQSHEDTEGMGEDDLVDFILTFVLAANDTSSLSLTWFFFALSKYPRVLAKIREEMAVVLPPMGVTPDTYLMTDHTQKLVYLEATIKEVLRVYPAIPLTQRQATEDTVIAGNLLIRKGTMVGISPYTMARLPTVWGPDAAEFKPERWIDEATGELITVSSAKFPTFSSGPRTCIGMKLAMLELRVATANLLHRYDFELAQPNDGSYVTATGLNFKHPLIVRAVRCATPTVA